MCTPHQYGVIMGGRHKNFNVLMQSDQVMRKTKSGYGGFLLLTLYLTYLIQIISELTTDKKMLNHQQLFIKYLNQITPPGRTWRGD